MSQQTIRLKIDVKAILKDALFNATSGKVYLDATLFLKDEDDQYGNCGMIVQDLGKERREAGEKGPILGNAKIFGSRGGGQSRQSPPSNQQRQQGGNQARRPDAFPAGEDEIPF